MEVGKVERYVNDLMTVSGIEREGKEQSVGLALYHLLMSAALRDLMDDDDKELFKALAKKVQYFFCSSLNLKERKRKTEKKILPPNPLLKEKEKKEKAEKTYVCVGDAKEAFHEECLKYVGQYDTQQLTDFYLYWSEENENGKMRFENERFWNTEKRLKRWVKNQYSSAITAAALRLSKLQKQQGMDATGAEQQRIAQERTDANDRLEQEIAERKKNAVSYEEWLVSKEKNNGVGPQGASKL